MRSLFLALVFIAFTFSSKSWAIGLTVISSNNAQSNAAKSFIYIKGETDIIQGIKRNTPKTKLPRPQPFVFILTDQLTKKQFLQWQVRTRDKAFGRLNIISKFQGDYKNVKPGRLWISKKLSSSFKERQILKFLPKPQDHQPPLYKKGRAKNDQRRKYGGGTKQYNDYIYNPRLAYEVTATIFEKKWCKAIQQK